MKVSMQMYGIGLKNEESTLGKGDNLMKYSEAMNLVSKKHKDSIIVQVLDAGDSFIIALEPKDLKKGDISFDSFFKVNKRTESITEYSPIEDPEEFKKALDHEVYSGKE